MFKQILVPLDGSARAEQALPVASQIAHFSGGTVVLLSVESLPSELEAYPSADPGAIQSIIDSNLEEARNYLQSKASSSNLADVHTQTEAIVGQVATAILSAVDTYHIDLIVMCSHGYTGIQRWAMGSVAEKVAHRSPVPVLMLRDGGPMLVGQHMHAANPLRALVPLDSSTHAVAAITPAAWLVAALSTPAQGMLHLLQVVVLPGTAQISHNEREAILQEAKQYLVSTVENIREGSVASSVADLKLPLTWSVTIDDDIASGIIRMAENGENVEGAGKIDRCDLIAMTTHGYGGLQQWSMGSVTERILQITRLPILIVPMSQLDLMKEVYHV